MNAKPNETVIANARVVLAFRVIETGLTDQVLDDPREPYTQLLVSSILPP